MYEKYWGLTKKPFENTPDPQFIYWSKQHEEAFSRMMYVIHERKGAAMLTGEYGSGKTLISRLLVEKLLSEEKYQTALILNPMLSPSQLIREIIHQLGGHVAATASKSVVYNKINELLFELHRNNKYAVVVVDEAQAIEKKANFEEFRLLLNFQLNDSFLLSVILIGQPELKPKINLLPQLDQRIGLKFHLRTLDLDETGEYIAHRMKIAGSTSKIFSREAISEIFNFSKGVPRIINNVCDLCLLVGSAGDLKSIDLETAKKVVADLSGREYEETEKSDVMTELSSGI